MMDLLVSSGYRLEDILTYSIRKCQVLMDAAESRLREKDKRMMGAMRVAQAEVEDVKKYLKDEGEE